jgi:excisionase family DNA binding protein
MSASEPEAMFLRPAEAAALTGLSVRAIYRAVQRGELGAVRLCSRLRIPRAAFEQWVERCRVEPAGRAEPVVVPVPRHAQRGSFRRLLVAAPERGSGR